MKRDLDESILQVFRSESDRVTYTEIKARLSNPLPNDRQVRRSLQRLWKDGKVARLDEYHQWGHHSFYSPLKALKTHHHPKQAGVKCMGLAEQRLLETLVCNLKSYLIDCSHNWSGEESPEEVIGQAVFTFNEILGLVQEALEPDWIHCLICQTKVKRRFGSPGRSGGNSS